MDRPKEKPPVWVGHIELSVSNFRDSYRFFKFLGMRRVVRLPGLAVLELRGGTHLVLQRDKAAEPVAASFDLMVEDLDAQHAALVAGGYAPGTIKKSRIHRRFEVHEPSGHTITFFDNHVIGPV